MYRIVPECHADTYLVEVLLKKGKPKHQKNIHKVKKTVELLAQEYPALSFAAVIDHDKNQKDFFESLQEVSNQHDVLHKRRSNIHYFIIKPALEQFIFNCCQISNINLQEFQLGNNVTDLRKFFKSPAIEGNHKFKGLINELVEKKSPGILRLQSLLLDIIAAPI